MKSSPVVHFELPAKDKKRVQKFYTGVFGWQTQELGPDMGNYILADTAETDANRMVKTPGAINGGIYLKTKPGEHTRLTISVDDIHKAMADITAAGGQVLGGMKDPKEPDEIPGVGLYATFIDTEGNILSILQPAKM